VSQLALPDLCTVSQVKQLPGMPATATADDPLLQLLVSDASAAIREFTKRDLSSVTYTEVYDGTNTPRLTLAQRPVTAVASVAVGSPSSGARVPLNLNTDYVWDDKAITRLCGMRFCREPQNVAVAYTAGYLVLPRDLELACARIVQLRYKQSQHMGQKSKSMGGELVTFDMAEWPEDVLATLSRHQSKTYVRTFAAAPPVLAEPA
jgi:hypothetical protein